MRVRVVANALVLSYVRVGAEEGLRGTARVDVMLRARVRASVRAWSRVRVRVRALVRARVLASYLTSRVVHWASAS